MKPLVTSILSLLILPLLFSCKKQAAEQPVKETYIQYFSANIAGKPLEIKGSIDSNRTIFHGSWTILGYTDGTKKELYTVNVVLPKTFLNTSADSKLQFQISDIHEREYLLSDSDPFKEDFASYIFLTTNSANGTNSKLYTTNNRKTPFNITINRYEKPENRSVPFVGGKLNGILYNEKNLQDSIVIKDGSFDVRF